MITMIDEIRREEQREQGRTPQIGKFGLRFILTEAAE
jgi:hypothetical protein